MKISSYLKPARKRLGDLSLKFDFMLLTGARLGAAAACRVDHYDPANRTLLLTSGTDQGGTKAQTKTRVLVGNELAAMLERLIKIRNLKPGQKFFKAKNR